MLHLRKTDKPRIGITLDFVDTEQQKEGAWYNRESWYALRYRYATAIEETGGIPFSLSYHMNLIDEYVDSLDGLLVTGGGFDVDPSMYGSESIHPTIMTKPLRTQFEFALCQAFLKANKPILGICGGMQLLNVIFGGTLHQHLPDALVNNQPSSINHSPPIRALLTAHDITCVAGTKLASYSKTERCAVNSVHHQAVDRLGEGLIVSAYADDMLIEALESPKHRFVLGIQWHPEFLLSDVDINIFKEFIESTKNDRNN